MNLHKGLFDTSGEGTPQLALAPLLVPKSYFSPNASADASAMEKNVDELWSQRRCLVFLLEMFEVNPLSKSTAKK